MLCQYCPTVMPMEGIEIEIEREGERSQNPGGKENPQRARAETSLGFLSWREGGMTISR